MKRIASTSAIVFAWTFAALAAIAAEPPSKALPDAASLWFLADVLIAPDGHVSDIEWRNYEEMPDEALADLERRIVGWEFRPGTIDGTPVATGTSLVIHAVAVERPDGRFGMEIAGVVPGPSLIDSWLVPNSPYRDVLTSGSLKSGYLVFDATFEPGGEAEIDIVETDASTGNRRYRAALKRDSLAFPAAWQVKHETLAGLPVEARFRFVNEVCWHTEWCRANPAPSMAGLPEVPYEQPVPLNSVVELLTDVVTVRILPALPAAGAETQ